VDTILDIVGAACLSGNLQCPTDEGHLVIIDRVSPQPSLASDEGAQAGDVAPDEQGLDRLGPLVGVDGFHVGHVLDDVVLEQNPVSAQQVAGLGEHLAGLDGVVELAQRRDCVGQLVAFLELQQTRYCGRPPSWRARLGVVQRFKLRVNSRPGRIGCPRAAMYRDALDRARSGVAMLAAGPSTGAA
jgi:hypothetical protein